MNAINKTIRVAMLAVAVALAGLGAGGCEKKEQPKPATPTPTPPPPPVTPKAGGSPTAQGATRPATAPVALTKTPEQLDLPDVVPPKDSSSAEQSKQAQDLVAGAIVAIKEKRLEEAKSALDKVDAMGDAVQRTTREQAKTVRANLEAVARLQQTDLPLPTEGENK